MKKKGWSFVLDVIKMPLEGFCDPIYKVKGNLDL